MSADLVVRPDLTIPAAELEVRTSRSSGPGGQHVNTTDTRVQLRWNVAASTVVSEQQRALLTDRLAARLTAGGELTVACSTHRSQRRNLQEARVRLAALIERALQERRERRPTKRSRAGHERRLERKRRRAAVKRLRRQLPDD
jgi:ribosome-associated protein